MTSCTLCFNSISEAESIKIDECFQSHENGLEILRLHFSFADKILTISRLICQICWSQLSSFHEFYNQVALNYQITTKIPAIYSEIPTVALEDVKVKIENDFDDNNVIDFQDFNDDDEIKEDFGTIESIKVEPLETTPKPSKSTKPNELQPQKPQTAQMIKNAADDKKIKETVDVRCDICKMEFDTFAHTTKHFRKVHKIKGYLICCGRKYMKKSRLTEHLNSHFNITFACDICDKTFFTKTILKRHKLLHQEMKLFQCDKCPKSFATKFQVRNHLHNVHLNENKELTFICPLPDCGKAYVNQIRVDHHIKYTHSGGDQIVCEVCSRTFAKRCYLDDHMRIHLRSKGLKNDRYKCHICEHFITGDREFRRHVKNHETEAWDNICPYCSRSCKSLKTLKKHIYFMHRMEAKHQCKHCGKCFKRPRDLSDHESIHTQQENYTCDFCPRTFRCHTNMMSHRRKEHPDLYQPPVYMREDV
ncbi:hypothetical protein PVAND_015331 [Polypedilum vanderplanki]|uniref:C2H2-type domain-containing protein n=1 Tax=Polypedilum vanderplanki TaxID=319348 RepID=A0A9J6BBY9_POLVA|nr:hypothetical protein PVAND_015331 [Polypedilum vanderplanki]